MARLRSKKHLFLNFGWGAITVVVPPEKISAFMDILGHCDLVEQKPRYALPADVQNNRAEKVGEYLRDWVEAKSPELTYRDFEDDVLSVAEYDAAYKMGTQIHEELEKQEKAKEEAEIQDAMATDDEPEGFRNRGQDAADS